MNYYKIAKKASLTIGSHPGLLHLKSICQSTGRILDVGCGEGTRLNILLRSNQNGWGIDNNPQAIRLAKKNYPHHHFSIADAQALPFANHSFDLVYSAFAIEHCTNPEKFLLEMIRVCKNKGQIIILCPNYGAPNRRSPVSIQNPWKKLLLGICHDFTYSGSNLNWKKVIPANHYLSLDSDTTCEPYLRSLIKYLSSQQITSQIYSSLWSLEPRSLNPRKFILSILGKLSIYPFKFWGPQIFYSGIKNI